jgi:hypothetical protein
MGTVSFAASSFGKNNGVVACCSLVQRIEALGPGKTGVSGRI